MKRNLMKSYFLSIAIFLLGSTSIAQTNTFPENGNVGIGTNNPFSRLHVKDGPHTGTIALGDDAYPTLLYSSASSEEFRIDNRSSFIGYLTFYPNGQSTTLGAEAMRICASGNIGIGTTDPKNYRLAVNGKIRAQEIKVEASPWPDYVFADSYSLPTLQETEKHIKEKGHLPGIPSAAEVKANGIDLGEMNVKLLQKIEELTLHFINEHKSSKENLEKINRKLEDLITDNKKLQKQIQNIRPTSRAFNGRPK